MAFKTTLKNQNTSLNLKKLSPLYLATIVSIFSPAVIAATMDDLITLGGNYGIASAVSVNGLAIVGQSKTASGDYHAFKYTETSGIADLGTLGGSGNYSWATGVSENGSVVVGMVTLNGMRHPFKYTDALGMKNLGSLGGNDGFAAGTSADGSVVVGQSQTLNGDDHAFKYTDASGIVDIGTLGGSNSSASGVSANGLIIVGNSSTGIRYDSHAFKYTEGFGMIDLGTLGGSNSAAGGISADGRVVVGAAETGGGLLHAFKHTVTSGMVDLGTLDGGSQSYAQAVSANGLIIVGASELASGYFHAFKHTDALGMVDLGTLGGNNSNAAGVSKDGSVIVGQSELVNGETRAFIYKTKMIDLYESQQMLYKAAAQQTAALSFLQDKLTDSLSQGCRPDAGNTCMAAGAKYYQQSNKEIDDTAAYVNIAHRFQPKFYAGIYLEQSVSSGFANTIDASNEQPLVALYGGFSPSGNNLGLQLRAAAATHKINADITRPSVTNTEAGKGSSSFKGYSTQLEAAYAVQVTDKAIISPVVGLRYSAVERGGYTESSSVDFPVVYGKMQSKQTNLFAGIEAEISLNKQINLYANAGVEQVLDHSDDAFTARAPYLGTANYSDPDVRNTKAYASTGISYTVAPNQKIGAGIGYRQASFKSSRDSLTAQVGYTVQF